MLKYLILEKSVVNDGGYITFYFKLAEDPPKTSSCIADTDPNIIPKCSGKKNYF